MQFTIREPGSAITHYIGMMMSVVAGSFLLAKAHMSQINGATPAMLIFILAMVSLYTASTVYHSVTVQKTFLRVFRKLDHMMIFVLIAGTYTPICLLVLKGSQGKFLLVLIWSLAIVGMLLKGFWITCPKWFSSTIYIAMGWACVLVFPKLYETLPRTGFYWLLAGGIIYTIGGVIYALKCQKFNLIHRYFGTHEIFHLFVMGGSICHFITMYNFLVTQAVR